MHNVFCLHITLHININSIVILLLFIFLFCFHFSTSSYLWHDRELLKKLGVFIASKTRIIQKLIKSLAVYCHTCLLQPIRLYATQDHNKHKPNVHITIVFNQPMWWHSRLLCSRHRFSIESFWLSVSIVGSIDLYIPMF